MTSNKNPGPGGLIVEFYKMYWRDIKDDLYDVIVTGLEDNQLAYSQYLAVITLLCKKGNRLNIKIWRPISLLNVDFKIASKSLAERIKSVLPDIIHTGQKSCIKGSFIGRKHEIGWRYSPKNRWCSSGLINWPGESIWSFWMVMVI